MPITFPRLEQVGRLGNQLWQIAATLGYAVQRGDVVALPPEWSYRPWFSIPESVYRAGPGTPSPVFATHLSIQARQYLQDLSIWSPHAEGQVREWFAPSPAAEAILKATSVYEAVTGSIAVHVRRGDNVYQQEWFWLPTLEYFERALATLPPAPVVVFSDDIPWCREHLQPGRLGRAVTFFEGIARPKEQEPDYMTAPIMDWVDLFLMTRARYHVISNSTYSWWAAWLSGNPMPIYPGRWFGPRLTFADPALMFPLAWIKVEA